jgi:hypothetical protein
MRTHDESAASKVPEVTLIFWTIKILATTLGEIGGDAVTMSMDLGYLVGTAIFSVIFVGAVVAQVMAKKFHPFLYWFTIVATTTLGTTVADFADRSLGIGYNRTTATTAARGLAQAIGGIAARPPLREKMAMRSMVAFYFDDAGEIRVKEDNLSPLQLLAVASCAAHYLKERAKDEAQKMIEGQISSPRKLAA